MTPLYLISSCTISPQHTYDEENFLGPAMKTDDGKLFVIDPDYTKFISPVAIRRMSRMLKRGITAGMRSLADAGIKTPDAIIVGTSRGSVTDMEIFLHELIELKEEALNPAGFIQSTYNSVNGWLAMLTKCTAYNQTFVHRGFSLELCLFDAMLSFTETSDKKIILAGAFDELTNEYYSIRDKIDHYKKQSPSSLDLLAHSNTPGSIAGEGAHFFVLSNRRHDAACAIHELTMLHAPSADDVQQAIAAMLGKHKLAKDELDVIVCGMNGDSRSSFLVDPVVAGAAPDTTIAAFKHLCGEYDTASGFGLWLAHYIFRKQHVPLVAVYKGGSFNHIRNMLFFNVTIAGNISLMLLRSTVWP